MIAKEKFFAQTTDPRLKAGDAAEKQMAHYLKRQFAEVQNVNVFNDLRLIRQGEVAQIDHLILHRHGTIIIESKSVTTTIRINKQHEFARKSGGKWGGMPSPVEQAKRQGELLRELLVDHRPELRDKRVFGLLQGGFRSMPVDVLVAISDQGIIEGVREGVDEVMKADRVAIKAMKIVSRLKKAYKLTSTDNCDGSGYRFTPDEFDRVTAFLLSQHTPLHGKTTSPHQGTPPLQPAARTRPLPAYLCTHCHSTNLAIHYGRSYFFNCLDCEGNTPIKNLCTHCGGNTTTSKNGKTFASVCNSCDTSEFFFVNPD